MKNKFIKYLMLAISFSVLAMQEESKTCSENFLNFTQSNSYFREQIENKQILKLDQDAIQDSDDEKFEKDQETDQETELFSEETLTIFFNASELTTVSQTDEKETVDNNLRSSQLLLSASFSSVFNPSLSVSWIPTAIIIQDSFERS
jgi:hypothetical protein